jgi:diphthamide synthase (EF-2-diphthine--ammonia ligase)
MRKPKALIAWSSGKDSAFALHEIRRAGDYEVVAALTTVTDTFARVSMHGVREELLRAQLDAAKLPSILVRIPFPCANEIYEREMAAALAQAKADGVTHVIFGDLFLADALAQEMIASGMQAHLATVDLAKLPSSFAGRSFDNTLLGALPPGIDPCGENGEFHSFVKAGPMFSQPIHVRVGETVEREGFAYADLLAA